MTSLSQDILKKINPTRTEAPAAPTPTANEAPAAPTPVPAPTEAAPAPTQTMTTERPNTVVVRPDDTPATPTERGNNDLQGLLDKLTQSEQPAPTTATAAPTPAAAAPTPAAAAPQQTTAPAAFQLPAVESFTEPAPTQPAPTTTPQNRSAAEQELVELRRELSTVSQTLEDQRAESERQRSRSQREQELEATIRNRFGDGVVPENVMQEFGDVFNAARNQVGAELGLEYGRQMLDLQDKIALLEAKLATEAQPQDASPAPTVEPPNEDLARQQRDLMQTYQQNLAATIPFYSEVMRHPNLQQMLDMPVNDLDPNRTWDMVLGEMLAGRDTGNIARFVEQFHGTYIKTDKRKSRAVPAPNSTGGVETRHPKTDSNTLNKEELNQLYVASMKGEIKLNDEQRLALRKAFASEGKAS